MPQTRDPARPLRLALRANAAFSTTGALLFLLDGAALAPVIGVPHALLTVLGFGLLAFAAVLVATSRRSDTLRLASESRLHCAADVAWVVGSVPIVALGWLTPAGAIGLAGVSTVVLLLAVAQWRGIGRVGAQAL